MRRTGDRWLLISGRSDRWRRAVTPTLPGLMLLLSPLLAAIVIMRPSWPEFLLLVIPLIAAIILALFAFRAASFLGLGLIGLLIGLCTISFEAEVRNLISAPVTTGLLERIVRARERATPSEHAGRDSAAKAQSRQLWLARLVGAEFVVLSLISWFVLA
jgi:uncharacterized membrane protein YoaK (UPF0700 family)